MVDPTDISLIGQLGFEIDPRQRKIQLKAEYKNGTFHLMLLALLHVYLINKIFSESVEQFLELIYK